MGHGVPDLALGIQYHTSMDHPKKYPIYHPEIYSFPILGTGKRHPSFPHKLVPGLFRRERESGGRQMLVFVGKSLVIVIIIIIKRPLCCSAFNTNPYKAYKL